MRPYLHHVIVTEGDQSIEVVLVELCDFFLVANALSNDQAGILGVLTLHH